MIVEVRTYQLKPGAREGFMRFFADDVLPRMAEVGMDVVGAFASLADPDVFTYIRRFPSLEVREAQYRAFYSSEDWLGWMIDRAAGSEERFEVFLGVDDPAAEVLGWAPSGTHAAPFTLATAVGVVTAVGTGRLTVAGEEGTVDFAVAEGAQLFHAPTGRGMQAAVPIDLEELVVGATVAVLAEQAEGGAVAHQVVRRG